MFIIALRHWQLGGFVRWFAIWVCGSLLFVSLQLVRERYGWGWPTVFVLGPMMFVGVSALFLASPLPYFPFSFLAYGLLLLAVAVPYLRDQDRSAFWVYAARLTLQGLFSAIGASILFLGGCAIVYSIEYLFGIDLNAGQVVQFLGKVSFYLVFPIALLAGIPSDYERLQTSYPKALRVIATYAMIPLLAIYTLILYAYMAKIAFAGQLPEGGVAYLVVGYALAGVITYLVVYPLEHGLAALFRKLFFPVLLAPLVLLAIAIGVRINEYGFTEERYTVLLCLVWLTLSAVLAMALGRMRAPALIVSLLAFLLIGASVGPWGAVAVSAWSQVGRLETALERSGVLVDGQIRQPANDVSREDRIAISEITDYLANTKKLDQIRPWFGDPEHPGEPNLDNMGAKTAVERMGIGYVPSNERGTNTRRRFSFGVERGETATAVAGYDYLIALALYPSAKRPKSLERTFPLKADGTEPLELVARFDPETISLDIAMPSKPAKVRFDLAPIVERHTEPKPVATIKPDSRALEESDGSFRVRLELQRIDGSYPNDGGGPDIIFVSGKLLIALE
ncbi:DUF4153 domain-containing protein [Methyloligella halotolerans]